MSGDKISQSDAMSSITVAANKANQENKENFDSILSKIVKKRPEFDETIDL